MPCFLAQLNVNLWHAQTINFPGTQHECSVCLCMHAARVEEQAESPGRSASAPPPRGFGTAPPVFPRTCVCGPIYCRRDPEYARHQ